uniref:Serpin family G member 1 n=1 Tax=Homo sapiens TaxID=9606 RepID=H0YCA1_HUMAN
MASRLTLLTLLLLLLAGVCAAALPQSEFGDPGTPEPETSS